MATVEQLISAGGYVALLDRATPSSDVLSSAQVKFFELDISIVPDLEAAVEQAVEWSQTTGALLGGVINCAAIGGREPIVNSDGETFPEKLWDRMLAVNLSGTFHLTRLASKHLVKVPPEGSDSERGVIIMTSSTAASEGQTGQVAYSACKGAIDAMLLPLARDLAAYGIRVVSIAPAGFATPMLLKFPKPVVDGIVNSWSLYPKRLGDPSEFASTVMWILQCGYVNGETIRLSGGTRVTATL